MKKYVVAFLFFSSMIFAGIKSCDTDIKIVKDSIDRGMRFLRLFEDKERALEEAKDAINYAKDAIVDCTGNPRSSAMARESLEKAKIFREHVVNYETKDEKIRRIKCERGLGPCN